MFVVRNKKTGRYLRGGRTAYTIKWVDSISQARVYDRKCDASNSISCHAGGSYWRKSTLNAADLEVISVTVNITNTNEATPVKISAAVLDRAMRIVAIEHAGNNRAPDELLAAFDELTTDQVLTVVTSLYGEL